MNAFIVLSMIVFFFMLLGLIITTTLRVAANGRRIVRRIVRGLLSRAAVVISVAFFGSVVTGDVVYFYISIAVFVFLIAVAGIVAYLTPKVQEMLEKE